MKITKGYLKEQRHTAKKAKDTNLGDWCLKEFTTRMCGIPNLANTAFNSLIMVRAVIAVTRATSMKLL